jgi:hypothetical protein
MAKRAIKASNAKKLDFLRKSDVPRHKERAHRISSAPFPVSRWSRRRERPFCKARGEPSGRPQRGDSALNKTLDHLLSLLTETLV